jgi:hypothetical protein
MTVKKLQGKGRFPGRNLPVVLGVLVSLLISLLFDASPLNEVIAYADHCTHVVSSDQELETANDSVQPGEVVCLRSGDYRTAIDPTRSGSPDEGYITFQALPGERPVMLGAVDVSGKSYLVVQGIVFQSEGDTWVRSDKKAHHIQLLGCEFDSSQAGSWQGVSVYGDHFVIRDSIFGDWWDGDMVYVEGSHALIEHNDFSQARGTHSLISLKGTHAIVRRNYFRNPWARAITAGWKGNRKAERILVEGNLFIDNNWNRSEPHPQQGSMRGSDQAIKFNLSRSIFRNNIIVNTNEGKDYGYSSALNLGTYEDVLHYNYLRLYHNTLYRNSNSGITISRNTNEWHTQENVFKNNIIADFEDFAINIDRSKLGWETYLFDTNIISDAERDETIYVEDAQRAYTIAQAQNDYADVFKTNIVASPQFRAVDLLGDAEAHPENYRLVDLDNFFCALSLQSGSPGQGAGNFLAFVTEAATQTATIRVDDALFFSDGLGLIPGDSIVIGENDPVRVVEVVDDTTLRLNRPIDVSVGDEVYLEGAGVYPDVGVYGCGGDGTPPSWDGSLKLHPEADAFVSGAFPSQNYGDSLQLEVDGEPDKVAYLRFDLSSLSGMTVHSAKLRIRIIDHNFGTSTSIQNIKTVSDDAWLESDMTYDTRPGLGDTVATIDGATSESYVEVDVTSFARSKVGQLLSLGIDSIGTDGLDFYSREHPETDHRPVLILTGSLNLYPEADAFVSGEFPSQNYGDGLQLEVDGEPEKVTLLRFDLSSLSGMTVQSAKLRIRVIDHIYGASTSIQNIKTVSDDAWLENDVTYGTLPSLGDTIATIAGGIEGSFVELDITSFARSKVGQSLSLGIDSIGTDGLDFYSREHADADRRPVLVLTIEETNDVP